MARREAQQAVTAKMYRHFAVVTVLATAALALATTDGAGEELDAQVEAANASAAAAARTINDSGQPRIVRRVAGANDHKPQDSAGWGEETGPSGSGPSSTSYVPPAYAGNSVVPPAYAGNSVVSPAVLRQLRLTPEQFRALSPEERRQLVASLNGGASAPPSPAAQAQSRAVAAEAALQRSGFSGPCHDC